MNELIQRIQDVVEENNEIEDIKREIVKVLDDSEICEIISREIKKEINKKIILSVSEFIELSDVEKKNIAMDKFIIDKINSIDDTNDYNLLPLTAKQKSFDNMLANDIMGVLSNTIGKIKKMVENDIVEILKEPIIEKLNNTYDDIIKNYGDYIAEVSNDDISEDEKNSSIQFGKDNIKTIETLKLNSPSTIDSLIGKKESEIKNNFEEEFDPNVETTIVNHIVNSVDNQEFTIDDIIGHIQSFEDLKYIFKEVPEDEFIKFFSKNKQM